MKKNIGIDQVNAMAFNSVNRLTSTIRQTLHKGNSLIRGQLTKETQQQRNSLKINRLSSQVQPIAEEINANQLYSKVKPFTRKQEKVKINIINILNFAEIKWIQFCALPNKTAHHYNEYLEKFKKVDYKLNLNLSQLTDEDSIEQIHAIKIQFKRIIQFLNQRARKYVDKTKQINELIKSKDKQQFEQQCQQEAIKEEMLQLLDRLKGQAINMGSDLKKDNAVISQIHQKQDRQLNVLSSKSKGLQDMMNQQKLGFFKLISYAGIGIVVWLFTLLFILIF